jgi:hypothetical protein
MLNASGEEAEREFLLILQRNKIRAHKRDGYFKDWDIESEIGTFEIKYDEKAKTTGNVFFEETYRGNPSGILQTKALFFAIKIRDSFYVFKTHELRERLMSLKETSLLSPVSHVGDNGYVTGVLIAESIFYQVFQDLFTILTL